MIMNKTRSALQKRRCSAGWCVGSRVSGSRSHVCYLLTDARWDWSSSGEPALGRGWGRGAGVLGYAFADWGEHCIPGQVYDGEENRKI